MTKVDYIIVGQGLAGTWLSYELLKRGRSIVVIDKNTEKTASKKAAGLYNPITGKAMVKTWRADDFFLRLEHEYEQMERLLKAKFLHRLPIYRPFREIADQNDWLGREHDGAYQDYIDKVFSRSAGLANINDPYGGILIKKSGYVDVPRLLQTFKSYLIEKKVYYQETFDSTLIADEANGISYKNWQADKVIFCEGPGSSPFRDQLKFRPVRGEIIDITCDLESQWIINQGVFMIPKKGFFTVGSTYDHGTLSFEPQPSGILSLKERLGKIFVGRYQIIGKRAGVRPATHDRRPYIGFHKKNETLAIFNGFGSKGVSLSPYFAKHFADVLEGKAELDKDVDVGRID